MGLTLKTLSNSDSCCLGGLICRSLLLLEFEGSAAELAVVATMWPFIVILGQILSAWGGLALGSNCCWSSDAEDDEDDEIDGDLLTRRPLLLLHVCCCDVVLDFKTIDSFICFTFDDAVVETCCGIVGVVTGVDGFGCCWDAVVVGLSIIIQLLAIWTPVFVFDVDVDSCFYYIFKDLIN